MKATRAMVAERAGVSPPTVSYYLNGTRKFSPETGERIRLAIEELGYVPDMIGKSLAKRRTRTIGVIMNDLANPLDSVIIKELQVAALSKDYFVNIFGFGDIEMKRYINTIIARRIDGIYITAIPTKFTEADLARLADSGIRILTSVNRTWKNPEIGHIDPDFMQGMRDAVGYLKSLGHSKIAYLSAFDETYAFDNRLEAYCDAMRRHGLSVDDKRIVRGIYPYPPDYGAGKRYAEELLARKIPFTALLATNDIMASAAMRVFASAGLRVPEDVSVIGIDDTYLAEGLGLTSLGYDKGEFSRKAFSMLYDSIKRGGGSNCDVPMELTVRDSTAKLHEERA